MEPITSRQNPKIKQIRALKQRKYRKSTGLFLVEGIRHVGEAVEAGARIEYLLVAPDSLRGGYAQSLVDNLQSNQIPIYAVTAEVFNSIAGKDNPSGILAVVQQQYAPLESLSPANFPWGVAVISPQDPGNIGTILRTIDAAGASGLILLDGGVDVYHPTAVRASMGALFWHPVVKATFDRFAEWVKAHNYHLYGTSAHAKTRYDQFHFRKPCILLLGSEREGLSKEQANTCGQLLKIPMHGKTTSLNLSIAAGILLYAMLEKE
jgi:TrmH family RNA methyltransferase